MGAGKKAGLNPHRKPGGQVTAAGGQTFVISWVGFDYNYARDNAWRGGHY